MGIPKNLTDLKILNAECRWDDRDVMLYALGIGMGEDPLDEDELAFVNEGWLTPRTPAVKVVPNRRRRISRGPRRSGRSGFLLEF